MIITENPPEQVNQNKLKVEIQPDRDYVYQEAVTVSGASETTLRRAMASGFLKVRRSSRRKPPGYSVVFPGSSLIEWIARGRKTGRTSAHIAAEINRAA